MKRAIPIEAYRCKNCGKIHYPAHERCLCCKGRDFEKIKPQGQARLLTYTAIYNLPWGFDQRYLIVGGGINFIDVAGCAPMALIVLPNTSRRSLRQ